MSAWRMGLLDPQVPGPAEWREGVIGSRGNSEGLEATGKKERRVAVTGARIWKSPQKGGDAGSGKWLYPGKTAGRVASPGTGWIGQITLRGKKCGVRKEPRVWGEVSNLTYSLRALRPELCFSVRRTNPAVPLRCPSPPSRPLPVEPRESWRPASEKRV